MLQIAEVLCQPLNGFNPHPTRRADATAADDTVTVVERFNPHPPRIADATPTVRSSVSVRTISILIRPGGRMLR